MRSLIVASLSIFMVAVSGNAFASELQLSALKRPIGAGGDMWDVILTSHEDELHVNHILLNRGNCHAKFMQKVTYPIHMKFGDQILMTMFDCNPVELKIMSDEGDAVLTFSY